MDIEARLIEEGLDKTALEVVRRATAPARHRERIEAVGSLLKEGAKALGWDETVGVAVLAALDVIGCGGPLGAGGPGGTGATIRIPQLTSLPTRNSQSGGAWSGAVKEHAKLLRLSIPEDDRGEEYDDLLDLVAGAGHVCLNLSDIDPDAPYWIALVPWLESAARRALIVEYSCAGEFGLSTDEVRASGRAASRLLEMCKEATVRAAIQDAHSACLEYSEHVTDPTWTQSGEMLETMAEHRLNEAERSAPWRIRASVLERLSEAKEIFSKAKTRTRTDPTVAESAPAD
jgi:hypothetical protein